MTNSFIQTGFASGELSPRLYGHGDLAKYQQGAARLRNMFVDVRGGASSRPGTVFCGYAGAPATAVKLFPFLFSTLQTYVLEFGNYYMRVWQQGVAILDGGGAIYQVATPYAAADVFRLRMAQSADTLWIAHPSYPQYKLTRTASNAWTFTQIVYGASAAAPTGTLAVAKVGAGTTTYRYVVTASIGAEESLPSATAAAVNGAVMSVNGNEFMTVSWIPVAGASVYSIYRQEEVPNDAPNLAALYGLVGTTQGRVYQDRNGSPDFAQSLPQIQNPFAGGGITVVTITAGGAAYSSLTYMTVTDPTGAGFRGFPVVTAGVITSVIIQQTGWLYTAPVFTFIDPTGAGGGGGAGGTVAPPVVPAPPSDGGIDYGSGAPTNPGGGGSEAAENGGGSG